jgi:hypothetical protein
LVRRADGVHGADLVENALFMVLLAQHPDLSEALVAVVRPITQVKLAAFWVLTVPNPRGGHPGSRLARGLEEGFRDPGNRFGIG